MIGNPCERAGVLDTPFVSPFDGVTYTLAQRAPVRRPATISYMSRAVLHLSRSHRLLQLSWVFSVALLQRDGSGRRDAERLRQHHHRHDSGLEHQQD